MKPEGPGVISREIAVRAYAKGFAIGADPLSLAKRHVVEPATHKHWQAGFEAGRRAVEQASGGYRQEISHDFVPQSVKIGKP